LPKPIDIDQIITIGGIKQYIRIKGKDDSKPILLILHGGPGGSLLSKTDQMTGNLQQHFVVVQWDQRETGETLKLNKSPQPLTLSLFYNDTHDIIDTLLKKFQKPKLYLAGYSWGSGLGFYIADKYPELLYAYIAISPVIDQWRSDSISLAMLKETMGKKARSELSHVKIPFENWEQLYYHRKWLLKQEEQKFVGITLRKVLYRHRQLPGSMSSFSLVISIFLKACKKLTALFISLPERKIIIPIIPSPKNILI
jgi:pimeloyl-ACP methyl ester carboxylesterase